MPTDKEDNGSCGVGPGYDPRDGPGRLVDLAPLTTSRFMSATSDARRRWRFDPDADYGRGGAPGEPGASGSVTVIVVPSPSWLATLISPP